MWIFYRFIICSLFHKAVGQFDPYFADGRTGIVHLVEWRYEDIDSECTNYLGPNGFGAVQISPVNEVRVMEPRSWQERYQPVSYRMVGRSGTEQQLRKMISNCNDAGVRVFVEVVLNNMADGSGRIMGTGGSYAIPDSLDYPGVPFTSTDFNYGCSIVEDDDIHEIRTCQLRGLPDLNQSLARVRQRIVDFLNQLIAMGVAGFYIDSAKYMWPHDLMTIYSKLGNLSVSAGFEAGSRPFIYQDVEDLSPDGIRKREYTPYGMVSEYRFTYDMADIMFKRKPFHKMVFIGTKLGYVPREKSIVFLDTPSLQRFSEQEDDPKVVSFKHRKLYTMALVFMMTHRYGMPRFMSSYKFKQFDEGPPVDTRGNIASIVLDEFGQCTGEWVCEHRWPIVRNIMKFRMDVAGEAVRSWVDNGQNQIAFCRGKVGFVAINAEISLSMKANLYTCLEPGVYCDLATGLSDNTECTGRAVKVGEDGRADIMISSKDDEPFLVLLANQKLP
ncbi:alpha-amylase 4N-like [Uranotaenia lowii]|uniref:alpha-amylase 4N-like n=1 Tax=Uranotaenia lowii TaxID=190385 RepID=UPI00247A08A6|nr:alpha-amylase 4N-like [Uranotaenia lowii]